MPIMPNTNLESANIIGPVFPADNEDTFLADASKSRQAAEAMRSFVEDMEAKRDILSQAMQGEFGSAYQENLADSIVQARRRADEFDYHADALEAAASNIAAAKLNMNSVDLTFHENMVGLQEWSFENDIPQYRIVEERDAMFGKAVQDVKTVDVNFTSAQSHVVEALSNGTPIDPSSLVSLAADAETSAAVLPAAGRAPASAPENHSEGSLGSFLASRDPVTAAGTSSDSSLVGSNSMLSGMTPAQSTAEGTGTARSDADVSGAGVKASADASTSVSGAGSGVPLAGVPGAANGAGSGTSGSSTGVAAANVGADPSGSGTASGASGGAGSASGGGAGMGGMGGMAPRGGASRRGDKNTTDAGDGDDETLTAGDDIDDELLGAF